MSGAKQLESTMFFQGLKFAEEPGLQNPHPILVWIYLKRTLFRLPKPQGAPKVAMELETPMALLAVSWLKQLPQPAETPGVSKRGQGPGPDLPGITYTNQGFNHVHQLFSSIICSSIIFPSIFRNQIIIL
jgi:hypothetical protein